MNEDKMELEEAVQELQERIEMLDRHIKNYEESNCKTNIYLQLVKEKQATETVLKALEKLQKHCKELIKEKQELTSALLDSIPTKKIEDKITYWGKRLNEDERLDWILRDKCIINELQELLEDK